MSNHNARLLIYKTQTYNGYLAMTTVTVKNTHFDLGSTVLVKPHLSIIVWLI